LAAAGIGKTMFSGSSHSQFFVTQGKIAIFDNDTVELSNLQRQILHNEKTIGWNKAKSAADALSKSVYLKLAIFA
jgi:molybdopterin/thiamine biosynthesis adenylyltransferase